MKPIRLFITLCILPILLGSCSVIKQTIGPINVLNQGKNLKQETAANADYISGISIGENYLPVKISIKKPEALDIASLFNAASLAGNPLSIAIDNFDPFAAIRLGKLYNKPLYSFIESWYGTPYRFGGTTRKGIDCSAFVRELYEEVYDTGLLRTAYQQFVSSTHLFSRSELKEGDLVFFKIHSRRISHVGVYLAGGYFVHASCSHGVTISNLNDNYWTRYYAGAGRIIS